MSAPVKKEETPARSDFEGSWRARFNRFAERGGSDATISGWSEHGLERRLEEIGYALERWPALHQGRFVDLGCGTGVYCKLLLDRGFRVVGADYSSGMLGRARVILGEDAGPKGIRLVAANGLELPFCDASFDGLINVGVLQHIARLDRVLSEMHRVLDHKGQAYLITLNRFSLHAVAGAVLAWLRAWRRGQLKPERHAIRRSPAGLSRAAQDQGFDTVAVRGVYLFPRRLGWLERLLRRAESAKNPLTGRPLLLPFANAMMLVLRRRD